MNAFTASDLEAAGLLAPAQRHWGKKLSVFTTRSANPDE
jgi:hypothetical protein